jgi:hypothetical protein
VQILGDVGLSELEIDEVLTAGRAGVAGGQDVS